MPKLKYLYIPVFFFFLIWHYPTDLQAEFYKYVDKEGRTFYVDDLSRVPPEYRDQVNVYKEKYDHLPAAQRESQRQQDLQQEALELERQRQIELELQQAAAQEEAERKRQEQLAKQKNMQTPVVIEGNRVLVSVTIANNGVEVEALLLLDTGASQTAIHRNIADQLSIVALKKGLAQVVGGQQIYAELGKVNYIKIGPHQLNKPNVVIINYEGAPVSYNGLLGMNILKQFKYNIDFEGQVIRWLPPE